MTDDNHHPGLIMDKKMNRRRFLEIGLVTAASCLLPSELIAALKEPVPSERSLSFYNIHTGESLEAVYWANGKYLSEPLAEMNHILRDHRTGKEVSFDTRLLDLLYSIGMKLEVREPFYIISGYRSPKTNALLRKWDGGVARKSLHMYGKAVDIRLPGFRLSSLRRVAMEQKDGGVGYSPRSGFIHLDLGSVRYWTS